MAVLTTSTRELYAQFLEQKSRQDDHRAGKNKDLFARPPRQERLHAFILNPAVQGFNWVLMFANIISMTALMLYGVSKFARESPSMLGIIFLICWLVSVIAIFSLNILVYETDQSSVLGLDEHETLGESIDRDVNTSYRDLYRSMLNDLTTAGYQLIAEHPDTLAATTHQGVVALVADTETGELVYTVNGHPLRDTYRDLAESHDAGGATFTTIGGATVAALTPIFDRARTTSARRMGGVFSRRS